MFLLVFFNSEYIQRINFLFFISKFFDDGGPYHL